MVLKTRETLAVVVASVTMLWELGFSMEALSTLLPPHNSPYSRVKPSVLRLEQRVSFFFLEVLSVAFCGGKRAVVDSVRLVMPRLMFSDKLLHGWSKGSLLLVLFPTFGPLFIGGSMPSSLGEMG